MDLNKKLIDQLSDLSRNIKSLTSEVKESNSSISAEPSKKGSTEKTPSVEEENKKFLKSLEEIFKKGISEITKSNTESKKILKDAMGSINSKGIESALNAISPLKNKGVQEIASNVKLPKEVSGLLGKLPKFADGGTMKKDGLAVVGEKGPEVVKLDKGDKVIPNKKSKSRDEIEAELLAMELEDRDREMDKFRKDTRINPDSSTMKTADQTLSPPKKEINKDSTIEEIKAKLLELDKDGYYKNFPEELDPDAEWELNNLKEQEKYETFTKEDIQKLSEPVKPAPVTEPTDLIKSDLSKKESRKKEREERKKEKEERKNKKEDILNKKEPKKEEDEKNSKLLNKSKDLLKEKGLAEKLKDKGKDIITGKTPLKGILKNPDSLIGGKNELAGKGIKAATSLIANKELRKKGIEKLKGLKKEKEEESSTSMNVESPELKPPKKEYREDLNKDKPKEEPKKEPPKKEEPKEKIEKKEEGKEPKNKKTTSNYSENKESPAISSSDLNDIKSILGRIANLLEGPLSIETNESPFRPDSRRF